MMRKVAVGLLAMLSMFCFASAALAQYPDRPVRIVVPYAAGGGIDTIARIVAQKLSAQWHQSVIVDNRPGAGAIIGTQAVVGSSPNGYTLLMTAGTLTVSPIAFPHLPYDVTKDLAPITMVAESPYILASNASLPVHNLQELIALSRKEPGKLNFGSPGKGTVAHLAFAMLESRTGIDAQIIHYRGSEPALEGMLGHQVDMVLDTPAALLSQIRSGKVRALAVTTGTRAPSLPDVPTIEQAGVSGYDVAIWFGLMAPAHTPTDIIARVHDDTQKILEEPDVVKRFETQGVEVRSQTPQQFAQIIHDEVVRWASVVHQARITFE
jgi:tripartite-type tricarboxylate transporter receptor subunit TctC